MTLQQIEAFLEVAKHGSFSVAAGNLYLSQPTLSRYIASLEDELGVELFLRFKNTVRLSDIGTRLLPQFRELYLRYTAASEEIRNTIHSYSASLSVGIQTGQSIPAVVRRTLQRIRADSPEIAVSLGTYDLHESYAALMDGTIDALVYMNATIPITDRLSNYDLIEEQMCLCVPASHPNSDLETVCGADMPRYFPDLKLCMLDVGQFEAPLHSGLRAPLGQLFTVQPEFLKGEDCSLDNLLRLTEAGLCMSIFNRHTVLATNPNVHMIPLCSGSAEAMVRASVGLCWMTQNSNPSLQLFLKQLAGQL